LAHRRRVPGPGRPAGRGAGRSPAGADAGAGTAPGIAGPVEGPLRVLGARHGLAESPGSQRVHFEAGRNQSLDDLFRPDRRLPWPAEKPAARQSLAWETMRRFCYPRFIGLCVLWSAPTLWAALPLTEVLDRMEQRQRSIQDVTFQFVERLR